MAHAKFADELRRAGDIPANGKMGVLMEAATNISLPEPPPAEVRNAARAECRSVDEVITDAVTRYVEDRSWTALPTYGAERAAALGINETGADRLIAESRAEHSGQ
jgi:hypothetical protein